VFCVVIAHVGVSRCGRHDRVSHSQEALTSATLTMPWNHWHSMVRIALLSRSRGVHRYHVSKSRHRVGNTVAAGVRVCLHIVPHTHHNVRPGHRGIPYWSSIFSELAMVRARPNSLPTAIQALPLRCGRGSFLRADLQQQP
jgi:hypothetical protein